MRSSFESCCCCRCVSIFFISITHYYLDIDLLNGTDSRATMACVQQARTAGEYRRNNNNNTRAHMQRRAAQLFSFCCCSRYYRSVTDHFRSISYTHYYHCTFFFCSLLSFFSILGLVSSNLSIPYREITGRNEHFFEVLLLFPSRLSLCACNSQQDVHHFPSIFSMQRRLRSNCKLPFARFHSERESLDFYCLSRDPKRRFSCTQPSPSCKKKGNLEYYYSLFGPVERTFFLKLYIWES